MAKKQESALQERIQEYIEYKGGYVQKNWGSMISEPGIADLTICYKGLYIAMEVKINDNVPTPQQGIHCRKVLEAGGISVIVWSLKEVKELIDRIDNVLSSCSLKQIIEYCKEGITDNGESY